MESKKWTDGWSSLVIGLLRALSVLKRHWAIYLDQFICLNQLHFQFDMFGTKRNKNFRSFDQRIWLSKFHVAVSKVFKSLLFLLNHFRKTFAAALGPVMKTLGEKLHFF